MILGALLGATVAFGGYYAYKHYTAAQMVAAVKAEVTRIEAEVAAGTLAADAKAYALAAVARLKNLLGL